MLTYLTLKLDLPEGAEGRARVEEISRLTGADVHNVSWVDLLWVITNLQNELGMYDEI